MISIFKKFKHNNQKQPIELQQDFCTEAKDLMIKYEELKKRQLYLIKELDKSLKENIEKDTIINILNKNKHK